MDKGADSIPGLGHLGLEAKGSPPRSPRREDGLMNHGEGSVLGPGCEVLDFGSSPKRGPRR